MKKNFLRSTLGMAVFAAAVTFTVFSCSKKKDDVVPSSQTAKGKASQRIVECESCNDANGASSTFNGQVLPVASVGNPANWTSVYSYNLPAGTVSSASTTGAQIQFGNFFDSFVSGLNGWNVGYLDGLAYNTTLGDITCTTIGQYGVIDDNNSLGMDDSDSATVNYGEGWYHYDNVNRTINPFRLVFAWLDCDNNGCISSGDQLYVIRLNVTPTFLPPPPTSRFRADVTLEYSCVAIDCATGVGSCSE